jgi:hypothetical protein
LTARLVLAETGFATALPELFVIWKRVGNEPEVASPVFDTGALKDAVTPAVRAPMETDPAVRSAFG